MGFFDFLTGSKENDDFYKTTPGNYSKMFEGTDTTGIKKGNTTKKNLTRNQRVALMGGPQPSQPQTNKTNSLASIPNFKGGKRTRKHRKVRKH